MDFKIYRPTPPKSNPAVWRWLTRHIVDIVKKVNIYSIATEDKVYTNANQVAVVRRGHDNYFFESYEHNPYPLASLEGLFLGKKTDINIYVACHFSGRTNEIIFLQSDDVKFAITRQSGRLSLVAGDEHELIAEEVGDGYMSHMP